jgi:hypothetical protein
MFAVTCTVTVFSSPTRVMVVVEVAISFFGTVSTWALPVKCWRGYIACKVVVTDMIVTDVMLPVVVQVTFAVFVTVSCGTVVMLPGIPMQWQALA